MNWKVNWFLINPSKPIYYFQYYFFTYTFIKTAFTINHFKTIFLSNFF